MIDRKEKSKELTSIFSVYAESLGNQSFPNGSSRQTEQKLRTAQLRITENI